MQYTGSFLSLKLEDKQADLLESTVTIHLFCNIEQIDEHEINILVAKRSKRQSEHIKFP